MKRRLLFVLPLIFCGGSSLAANFAGDFDQFWSQINSEYPYFAKKQTDWQCVRKIYRPQAAATNDKSAFIRILERALDELYDPHATLNTNLPSSTRLIPSGLDVWAEREGLPADCQDLALRFFSLPGAFDDRRGSCIR